MPAGSNPFPSHPPSLTHPGHSVDYIHDITAELRQLLGSGALPPPERLRVLLTAAETVQSQASRYTQQGHPATCKRSKRRRSGVADSLSGVCSLTCRAALSRLSMLGSTQSCTQH